MSIPKTTRRRSDGPTTGRLRAGIAQIELVLSLTVLVAILLLIWTALHLGQARLGTLWQAANITQSEAFRGTAQQTVQGVPIDGYLPMRPGLPNRIHSRQEIEYVRLRVTTEGSTPLRIGGSSMYIGPAQSFSAYPFRSDRPDIERWFVTGAIDSHGPFMAPLELAPPWQP